MLDLRPILMLIGILLSILAGTMIVCGLVDIYYVDADDSQCFFFSAFLTAFIGGGLYASNRVKITGMSIQQGFLFTTLSWAIIPLFAALPFYYTSAYDLSYTDSFFEAVSGLASCGATVLTGLDTAPHGILLWRALLNWLGGIGIIMIALAILPMLQVGGMQLFKMESSDRSGKILPRARQIAYETVLIYVTMTIVCTAMLVAVGMEIFDAICHAMAALATGGFGTKDTSVGYFNNPAAEIILIIFMILSSLPYVLFIQAVRGRYTPLLKDKQVHFFLLLLAGFIVSVAIWLAVAKDMPWLHALRLSAFNVTSIMTTCGFFSDNYALWGAYPVFIMFLVSIIGGCTGSTAGAIKIFRFQVLLETTKQQILQLIHPHRVYTPSFNGRPLDQDVITSVLVFLFIYFFFLMFFTAIVSISGADFLTSFSAVSSAMAAAGYGLGDIISPAGSYAPLSGMVKWVLCIAMIMGRLEFFTVMVIFTRTFWR